MAFPAAQEGPAGRASIELADIFREHATRLGPLSGQQARVVRAILSCRTSALGGHVLECDRCGHQEMSYNSCRDRHCPKCQSLEAARWVEAQKADLLPVPYFHVVFTIPETLHGLFRRHARVGYDLLFKAVSETLREVALNPKHLGARIGFLAVLHTWTQKLLFHPHIHCVIPGGGLSPQKDRWISCRSNFFLPVRVLSTVFRGKLLSFLQDALATIPSGSNRSDPMEALRLAARQDWVVYSKPPFSGPQTVLEYLSRYTHRIAISNQRLLAIKGGEVTFLWRDRAEGNAKKLMTLEASEFMRRFLLHVLPKGFVRLRHYGFLANAVRSNLVERCRKLLQAEGQEVPPPGAEKKHERWQDLVSRLTGVDPERCPLCKVGRIEVVAELLRSPLSPWRLAGRGSSP